MDTGVPPPPYAGHKPPGTTAPYPPPHPFNGSHAAGPFASPPRSQSPYGPTPLGLHSPSEGVGILPYYNPDALHTQELYAEARRRARWRFITAFMWALCIYIVVGGLTSATVIESRALRR